MGRNALALEEAVAAARLSGGVARRREFTVAHQEAVLAMRRKPSEPWEFTLALVRAAVALSRDAVASLRVEGEAENPVLVFSFVLPDADWAAVDVGGVLTASLEPDRGSDAPAVAWRRLVGRAVNGALGTDPPWVELATPVGGRRWDLAAAAADADPYAERLRSEELPPRTFVLRVARPERSFVSRLWSSPTKSIDAIAALWAKRLGRPLDDLADGVRLVPEPITSPINLGGYATWTPDKTAGVLTLERDGVLIAGLHGPGLEDPGLHGRVDCPALRLDVDERSVVADDKLDLLIAWLHDDGTEPPDLQPYIRGPAGEREVLFDWPHRRRSEALALSPSQLAKLRELDPEIEFVPYARFTSLGGAARADFTALAQGSYGPVRVEAEPIELESGATVPLTIRAYVHKFAVATQGAIKLLAWHRLVATVSVPERVLPGVTLAVSIPGDSADPAAFDAIADHAHHAAAHAEDALVGAALAQGGDALWSVPLVRRTLEALDAVALGLRFELDDDALRLAWDDTPILGVEVGRERDGSVRTLGDALVRARDVGGVVHGAELKRWYTLESDDPKLSAWILTDRGRSILHRVLGPLLLWEMPVVPEAQPRPLPAAEQPQLLLGRAEVARKVADRAMDARSAEHLLAHALVARALERDAFGLSQVPLLRRYDPRALTPRRRVSIATVVAEQTRRVAPLGAVGRWLEAPVFEVTPAVAALLHETLDVGPAEGSSSVLRDAPHARAAPVRAPKVRVDPAALLVRVPVADRLCAGALHLAEQPARGIELWAKGLRVGSFRLPSPLRELGGRLWLTDAGIDSGHAGIVKVALERGRVLVEQAVTALALSRPKSRRHDVLQAFIDEVRTRIHAGGDRLDLGRVVGVGRAATVQAPVVPLRRVPPPRERLQAVLRFALDRAVQFETAWLSWRAAKVLSADPPGRVELGSRQELVGKALADDAPLHDVWPAAILVVATVLHDAPALGDATVALARILASARSFQKA